MHTTAYQNHIATLCARMDRALERSGHDHALIAAGVQKMQFLDDMPYPFAVNPHFKAWAPLTQHPDCWIAYTPGAMPVLVYMQPDDYWHLPPAPPSGYWTHSLDVRVVRAAEDATKHFPTSGRIAILGEADAVLPGCVPNNPQPLLDYLHYHRAFKTPYEIAMLKVAQREAVAGHRAAEACFRDGGSELDIHHAYLVASTQTDRDLPYGNIVGLNEHGATLHYQHQQAKAPGHSHSLLIDAGAAHAGYAADITRTHHDGDERFGALVAGVDREQQALAAQVRPGMDYRELHLQAHRRLAGVLREVGVVRMDAGAMVETGVSSVFFPHGLGHQLGLQVHDIGGFMASDAGGTLPKPEGHPYLRMTRTLEAGMVVTIEPGLYFIDLLLAQLKAGPHAQAVDWAVVEHLRGFGGVRIEDDVHCTDAAPENLTREAFAAAH
ncbi:MAG: Xaa-Pro dipeptidase [Proteobacteria bacterium]|nr:Xaa-Pro dipeptidase [Pseudomonadota bacterium]